MFVIISVKMNKLSNAPCINASILESQQLVVLRETTYDTDYFVLSSS